MILLVTSTSIKQKSRYICNPGVKCGSTHPLDLDEVSLSPPFLWRPPLSLPMRPLPLILRVPEATLSINTGGLQGLSLSRMVMGPDGTLSYTETHVCTGTHVPGCTRACENTHAHTKSLARWTLHTRTQAHMNICACMKIRVHGQVYMHLETYVHVNRCAHAFTKQTHTEHLLVTGLTED